MLEKIQKNRDQITLHSTEELSKVHFPGRTDLVPKPKEEVAEDKCYDILLFLLFY